jgi:predicted esterase YcpF (UPF0227 family)
MNILYLHGFRSSSNSPTVNYLKNKLSKNGDNFFCFDLPTQPKQAIDFIKNKIKKLKIDILIGTSLGGLYAYNFEIPRICINPAFEFKLTANNYTVFNNRNDNITEFTITEDDVDYLTNLVNSFKNKLPIDPLFYMSDIVIGTDDDHITYNKLSQYTNIYDNIIYKKFGHRLTENIIDNVIVGLVNDLKNSISALNKNNLHE